MQSYRPSAPLDAAFRAAVANEVSAFLDEQVDRYGELGDGIRDVFALAREFTAGGKRIRPAFCYWSYIAATDAEPTPSILRAAASLDLLHVSALMHDDVMDASATRRGVPAAHLQYEALHREAGGSGSSAAFGRAGAILLGDLLLTLSVEMFDTAGLSADAFARASTHLRAMRTEVALGQFLDVSLQALPPGTADEQLADAIRVTEYKTARYSVRRPCQIGGALAGADASLDAALAAFGSPLGRAFQLRDDLLGIFGDPDVTGKPAGDDLREGKRTVLMALALAHADAADAIRLAAMLGDPSLTGDQVVEARDIIVRSGAKQLAERRIADEYDGAMAALASATLTEPGRVALTRLAELSVQRDY